MHYRADGVGSSNTCPWRFANSFRDLLDTAQQEWVISNPVILCIMMHDALASYITFLTGVG
jgi:hypothetical protein